MLCHRTLTHCSRRAINEWRSAIGQSCTRAARPLPFQVCPACERSLAPAALLKVLAVEQQSGGNIEGSRKEGIDAAGACRRRRRRCHPLPTAARAWLPARRHPQP